MKTLKLIAVVAVLMISGCSYAHLGMKERDGYQEIFMRGAGGYTSPESMMGLLEQQAQTEIIVLVQTQLRDAIQKKDAQEIQRLQILLQDIFNGTVSYPTGTNSAANMVAVSASDGTRMLGIVNRTNSYTIKMKSSPFADVVLAPGESSRVRRAVNVGTYPAQYEQCRIGDSYCTTKKVNVSISRNRVEPLVIFEN